MSDHHIPSIVDCECGLRYLRTSMRTTAHEIGHFRCPCGQVVGAWNGDYRLSFEPEELPPPRSTH
jgi:hypothetical protein